MGKGTDKAFITAKEWSHDFGGAKTKTEIDGKYKRLPFESCALSLQPFEFPVCSPQGHVFDLQSIVPWITEQRTNPITGARIEVADLVKLHMHKNTQGNYHCPVTFRAFNEHTHVVAVRTGNEANVYAWDAVDRLNVKTKHWKDLLNDRPFVRADIITLQDPQNPQQRDMSRFHHLTAQHHAGKKASTASKLTQRIMKELDSADIIKGPELQKPKPDQLDVNEYRKPEHVAHFSKGKAAASLTSTSMPIVTYNESVELCHDEAMYRNISKKGYVQVETNFGNLNVELYTQSAPKTCHNFILLAKSGYFKDVKFHRLIPKFMIQSGDPGGTGSGGDSFWKGPFDDEIDKKLSHNERGILSMANSGKNTNKSQFFITFGPCTHLDGKHTIFGKVVDNIQVLDKLETIPTNNQDRPSVTVKLHGVQVLTDPFDEYQKLLKTTKRKDSKDDTRHEAGPSLAIVPKPAVLGQNQDLYTLADDTRKQKKAKRTDKLTDFGGW